MEKPRALFLLVALIVGLLTALALRNNPDSQATTRSALAASGNQPGGASQGMVEGPGGGSVQAELQRPFNSDDHLPLMIRWSNWRPEFGPAYVYARESDLSGMLRMDGPVQKMLMVTSYAEAERLMARAGDLRAAGVMVVGLNTEGGLSPASDMQTLNSTDPSVNVVARVASLVTRNGFQLMWGPIRNMTDQVGDEAVRTMMRAGMTGLALQEQKFIENQPADARLTAVQRTRERYLGLAKEVGVADFTFHVQIMHERCPNLNNCVTFVQGLEQMPVDSLAIWSNGPIPVDFISTIRSG